MDNFPAIAEPLSMNRNPRSTYFNMRLQLIADELGYRQSVMLDIYGPEFDHNGMNRLHEQ